MSCKEVGDKIETAVYAIFADKQKQRKLALGDSNLLPRTRKSLVEGARGM